MAEGPWSRRDFVGKWRRLGGHDPRWRPPHLGALRRTLAELKPLCLWLEALPRDPTFRGSSFEVPVATAAVRRDPERPDTGYLTLLHFVNDRDTLHVLLENLSEQLRPHGIRTLLGPTHLLPLLGGGALSSHWQLPPPADTPYGPPYAPEHLGALMSPLETLSLFHHETLQTSRELNHAGVTLRGLEPARLATDLPLLGAANLSLPPSVPGAEEAQAVVRWLAPHRPFGFVAVSPAEVPLGFVLVYSGRLWGGVLPDFRRQGIGRALLHAGLGAARGRGWSSVSVGPIPLKGETAAFLQTCGGVPRQRYTLYRTGF